MNANSALLPDHVIIRTNTGAARFVDKACQSHCSTSLLSVGVAWCSYLVVELFEGVNTDGVLFTCIVANSTAHTWWFAIE